MKFSKLTRQREIGIRATTFSTGSLDADLSDPQYDSRKVKQGSTFFAIRGFAQDGHQFIAQAIERGATTIICEDDLTRDDVNVITVDNSRKALAIISEEVFGSPSTKLRLVGVTGTNGKTTTTNLIKQLLEARGEKVGLIGTLGVWIGDEFIHTEHTTPESRELSEMLAKMVEAGVSTCVMEVSSHSVTLERVSALDFDIGVFTNLTQDHLDFHKTMEAYADAKQQFFNRLKETAVAITNADDVYGPFMAENSIANVHSYGREDGSEFGSSDIVASNITYSLRGTSFDVRKRYSDEKARFESTLVGEFNVENLLAATSALYFGIEGFTLDVLSELVTKLQPVRGRFEQIALPNGALAIIDYAHTPDALENVLATIQKLRTEEVGAGFSLRTPFQDSTQAKACAYPDGKIITVFGCGGDRDKTKRPLMGAIAEKMSDEVIITSDNPRTENPEAIIQDILVGIKDTSRIKTIADRKEAINFALSTLNSSDILLIAGKGHEDYQIIGKEKVHFDDKEIVLAFINVSLRGGL